MPREGQIARLLRLVQVLGSRKQGVTVGEVAREENCSPRTVYRDLAALENAGYPIYSDKEGPQTLWKFVDGYRHCTPVPFEINELAALYYSRGMFDVFKGTVFHDSLESFVGKIRTSLAPETLRLVEQIDGVLAFGRRAVRDYGRLRGIVQQVSRACGERRRIEMVYYTLSRDAETKRVVNPYKIWYFEGALYLIGFCGMRREVRMFALDRIRLLEVKDESFTVPEDFSVDKYMTDCFGLIHDEVIDVQVRFTGDAARWVADRKWHRSQEPVARGRGGSLTVRYRVSGTSEIKRWILGFGPDAVVLAPAGLRDEIVRDASAILAGYGQEGTASAVRGRRSSGR